MLRDEQKQIILLLLFLLHLLLLDVIIVVVDERDGFPRGGGVARGNVTSGGRFGVAPAERAAPMRAYHDSDVSRDRLQSDLYAEPV